MSDDRTAEKDVHIGGHYCGQIQPHAAHVWQSPATYGQAKFVSTYQCGGVA